MTVDYLSLYVRVQRRVLNHLTPAHTLGPPRIASTGSYDTSSYFRIRLPGRRNTTSTVDSFLFLILAFVCHAYPAFDSILVFPYN